eukprot:g4950.t1
MEEIDDYVGHFNRLAAKIAAVAALNASQSVRRATAAVVHSTDPAFQWRSSSTDLVRTAVKRRKKYVALDEDEKRKRLLFPLSPQSSSVLASHISNERDHKVEVRAKRMSVTGGVQRVAKNSKERKKKLKLQPRGFINSRGVWIPTIMNAVSNDKNENINRQIATRINLLKGSRLKTRRRKEITKPIGRVYHQLRESKEKPCPSYEPYSISRPSSMIYRRIENNDDCVDFSYIIQGHSSLDVKPLSARVRRPLTPENNGGDDIAFAGWEENRKEKKTGEIVIGSPRSFSGVKNKTMRKADLIICTKRFK